MANSSSGSAAEAAGGEERGVCEKHDMLHNGRQGGFLTAGYPHLGGGGVVVVVKVEASARCIKQARAHRGA